MSKETITKKVKKSSEKYIYTIEEMKSKDIKRLSEINRTEKIKEIYNLEDNKLTTQKVKWTVNNWSEESEEKNLKLWSKWLEKGKLFGAFIDDDLIGFMIYRPKVAAKISQIAVIQISKGWRNKGIGKQLIKLAIKCAKKDKSKKLYAFATPVKRTVDFYMKMDFTLIKDLDKKNFELDLHEIPLELDLNE